MHKCVKSLLIILFALTQVMAGFRGVLAHDVGRSHLHEDAPGLQLVQFQYDRYQSLQEDGQSNGIRIDVEPPLIEHDVIDESEADIRQTFVATVVDDEELDSVLFFYRYAGETSFSRYVMTPVSFSYTYIAQIPTDPDSYTPIEYYIQARDTSGNRTVRGYAFSPLVRNIIPRQVVAEQAGAMVDAADPAPEQAEGKLPKAVYILGGVLLLGLIASAASSSGGGSGGNCEAAGCRLSLTLNPPF